MTSKKSKVLIDFELVKRVIHTDSNTHQKYIKTKGGRMREVEWDSHSRAYEPTGHSFRPKKKKKTRKRKKR